MVNGSFTAQLPDRRPAVIETQGPAADFAADLRKQLEAEDLSICRGHLIAKAAGSCAKRFVWLGRRIVTSITGPRWISCWTVVPAADGRGGAKPGPALWGKNSGRITFPKAKSPIWGGCGSRPPRRRRQHHPAVSCRAPPIPRTVPAPAARSRPLACLGSIQSPARDPDRPACA
jgi:hypothetical protein